MSFSDWGFGFPDPTDLRDGNARQKARRRKNLLGDPWDFDLLEIDQKPPRGPRPFNPALAEDPFRKAAQTILERSSRGQEGLEMPTGRQDTTRPLVKPTTPWWQAGTFEDIGADGYSENGRQVSAILKTGDNGDLPIYIADALNTGTQKAQAEVADLFRQLSDRDPKRATELTTDVDKKVAPEIHEQLMGLKPAKSTQTPPEVRKPIEPPIAGMDKDEESTQPRPPAPSVSTTLSELGEKTNKIARGILGPAYDQAAALLKFAEELSPGADIRDALDGSGEVTEGIKNTDPKRIAAGSAAMAAGIAGIFLPGSAGGINRVVRAIEDGGKGGASNFRRDISDMPYEQRLKHEGDAPVIPDSPEANIDRGYKSMAGVLKTGKADMAAMHRKDLGWIAFEPGEVATKESGKIVGGGLKKIAAKHADDLAMLPEVVQRGKLRFEMPETGRRSAILEHAGYKTVFRLNKLGKRETWVLTHFKNKGGSELLR